MEDHDEKAEELEREVEDLEQRSEEVGDQVEETKEEWESRQQDENTPGAVTDDATDVTLPDGDPQEGDEDAG